MADIVKRNIAIDLGVCCGKVELATVVAGKVMTETVHSFPIPAVDVFGQRCWDIFAAYAGVVEGLAIVGSRGKSVESIGIDAWGPGVVCVARDGTILGMPCLSGEVLSEAVQTKFFKRMERRELYETTGVNVLDSHAALQLFGLRRRKSVALDDAKYLLFIPEAISYLLTGKRYTELSSLSAAGLLDRSTGKISKEILSACKVRPRRFPSMVLPGSKLAKLSEGLSQATGLGRVQVVAVAGHALASSVAALPALQSSSPEASPVSAEKSLSSSPYGSTSGAFLRLGSVSEMGVQTASPIVNDQTYEMNFSNETGAWGTNILVKRIVGTDLLERCVAAWRAAGRAYGPEDLARMAREGAPTAAQLDPEDPSLRSASDAPAAIARFCSLRSMVAPADDAATVRLIIASFAEKIGDTFIKLQSVTPFRLKSLTLLASSLPGYPSVASPSLAGVISQMVADECAVPVTLVAADAAVLGNVLVQSGFSQSSLTPASLADALTSETFTPGLD